jgi:HEAT repeat protein
MASVEALNKIGGTEAVETLVTLLSEGANLSIHAMHALKVHAPDRLVPLLLKELESASLFTLPAAGMILAELGETRALPILARIVENPEAPDQTIQLTTQCIARFGSAGLPLLKYLINNSSPIVRKWTAAALHRCWAPDMREVYQSLLSHPDEQVRKTIQLGLDLLPPSAP